MEIEIPRVILLDKDCTGEDGAESCQHAYAAGARVHMIMDWSYDTESLIMPSYHFTSEEHGRAALEMAYATAPTISTDDELYAARRAKIPHKLPVGWIDPSRR